MVLTGLLSGDLPPTRPFTMAVWFKIIPANLGVRSFIVGVDNGALRWGLATLAASSPTGSVTLSAYEEADAVIVGPGQVSMSGGRWQSVVTKYNSTTVRSVSADKNSVVSASEALPLGDAAFDVIRLGRLVDEDGEQKFRLAHLLVFNGDLTEKEIQWLHEGYIPMIPGGGPKYVTEHWDFTVNNGSGPIDGVLIGSMPFVTDSPSYSAPTYVSTDTPNVVISSVLPPDGKKAWFDPMLED